MKSFGDIKKKTSEIYTLAQSDYISFFTYSQCDFCEIDSYSLTGVESGQELVYQDGSISMVMGLQDVSTSFNIVPTFNDDRCIPLFLPSLLEVTMNIEHECNGDDTIIVRNEAAIPVFKNKLSGGVYHIESAQDLFNHQTSNTVSCGLKSVRIYR